MKTKEKLKDHFNYKNMSYRFRPCVTECDNKIILDNFKKFFV